MTIPEYVTAYSMQISLVSQTGVKTTRTISDVIRQKAVAYMAATPETREVVDNYADYAECLANLTGYTLSDSYLTAKTSTNTVSTDLIGG